MSNSVMPELKDVAELANVSLVTAYQVLSSTAYVDESIRQHVIDAAIHLNYRLNVTIRDVASEANVSIATVSYVLNNSAQVSAATRQRVLDAVKALGYRTNSTARNLKTSETRTIGYAWHHIPPGYTNPVLERFLYSLSQAAESFGYHVLTFTLAPENPTQAFEELVSSNRVDGFVLADTTQDDPRIRRLIELNIPFVVFGRSNEDWDFPYVDTDGEAGLRLAVEHLIVQGHERIGFLGWPEGSLSGDSRLRGYLDALEAAGIAVDERLIIHTYNTASDGADGAKSLLSLRERPTAIVCVSDLMALGVIGYLSECGYSIGHDVSVTGFDDDPLVQHLRPALTSLRQPIEMLATHAMEMLMAQLEKRSLPHRHILLAPTLIVRDSSRQSLIT